MKSFKVEWREWVVIVTALLVVIPTVSVALNIRRIDMNNLKAGLNKDILKQINRLKFDLADMSNDDRKIDPNLIDPKHKVKMGIKNLVCDDGEHGIAMDWDPNSSEEYACTEDEMSRLNIDEKPIRMSEDRSKIPMAEHVCLYQRLDYNTDLPLNGSHRPLWPRYGEYTYLPPQRWVHSLEHGAIVLLYHPCVEEDPDLNRKLKVLKKIVRGCLQKHIISPYRKIPHHKPFALVAYGRAELFSSFDVDAVTNFIEENALKAPESFVEKDGQYEAGLKSGAKKVADIKDRQIICPTL